MKKLLLVLTLFVSYSWACNCHYNTPKLTVVIVVDQLAHHYFTHHKSLFSLGLKTFLEKGIVYDNAYHPHGIPVTAAGHATLSTGTYPKHHGFALNSWISSQGEIQSCTEDNQPESAIFKHDGTAGSYGESACHLMVPTISDMLKHVQKNTVFSLSYKPRAAIGLAGKLGKAIWFNEKEQVFTSSKAYFAKLPKWLKKFNKKHALKDLYDVPWKTFHPLNHPIYKKMKDRSAKLKNHPFIVTPKANDILFDLAKACIIKHLQTTPGHFLLWIAVSSLDKIGHIYGPSSIYTIDTLCHLDSQIQDFISFVHTQMPENKAAFILTSDHGVAPFPEAMHKKGLTKSKRIQLDALIDKLNAVAEKEFALKEDIIRYFKTSSFFINNQACKHLTHYKKRKLLERLRQTVLKEKGIAHAWTPQDLKKKKFFLDHSHAHLYEKQLYPGRLGDLICMPTPYSYISRKNHGTSHRSPYEYDTHVPLIVYHPQQHKPSKIISPVCTTQLAPTLAKILNIAPPPTCQSQVLPGI